MAWSWETGYKFVLLEGTLVLDDERRPITFAAAAEPIGLLDRGQRKRLLGGGRLSLSLTGVPAAL